MQACEIVVVADGSADTKAKAAVNVVEPMLVVKQTGPAHCLVKAEPTYTIELSNPGTAATDPVTLAASSRSSTTVERRPNTLRAIASAVIASTGVTPRLSRISGTYASRELGIGPDSGDVQSSLRGQR